MKHFKSLISLLLALIMVMAIVACSDPSIGGDGTGTDTKPNRETGSDDTTAEQTTARLEPDIPDVKYDGQTITFLVWKYEDSGTFFNDITSYGYNQEAINDATYNRNLAIEEKYGITIQPIEENRYSGGNLVSADVAAGDCTYNVVVDQLDTNLNLAVQGNYMNLNNLDYLDFDKPWWDSGVIRDLSIGNAAFIASGDILTRDNGATVSVIFNQNMIKDKQLENPFDLVDAGTWTFDKMYEMMKVVGSDVGNDGVMDKNDTYGLLGEALNVHMMLLGADNSTVGHDAENYLHFTNGDERTFDVLEKAYKLLTDTTTTAMTEHWDGGTGAAWTDYNSMFMNDQSLFMIQAMEHLLIFRDMVSDPGIVPLPKYDETQKEYFSTVNMYWFTNIAIPMTNTEVDMISIILEAMAAESHYTINEEYYDTLMQWKCLRDDRSREMLQMILANRRFDMAVYGGIGDFHHFYKQMIIGRDFTVFSNYAANITAAQKRLDIYTNKYNEYQYQ